MTVFDRQFYEYGQNVVNNIGNQAGIPISTAIRYATDVGDFSGGVATTAGIVSAALTKYNPYIQAAAAIPVVVGGAKWLIDQLT